MRLRIATDYGFKPNPAQLAALQKHDPSVDIHPMDDKAEWSRGTVRSSFFADPTELYSDPALYGVMFRIEGGQIESSNLLTVLHHVQEALNRVAGLAIPATPVAREQLYNERCNVHVPGLGLLIIDEVQVHTDCCTEELQQQLDTGWRILAVCPQPDKRRPDYVLGRKAPVEKLR